MSEKIKAEVMKQFNAGFMAVTSYPQWVANIVPVLKKDGKVRMCVDYRDLNRASPKDDFPLPHIGTTTFNHIPAQQFFTLRVGLLNRPVHSLTVDRET